MSKKLTYNTTRFDGGMTDSLRNTSDVSKCAFSSHFDIYSNPEQLRVMPGYVADETLGEDATGMRDYKIRAFATVEQRLICAGEKLSGGGSKIFSKSNNDLSEPWIVGAVTGTGINSEADANLLPRLRAAVYSLSLSRIHVVGTTSSGGSGFMRIAVIRADDTPIENHLSPNNLNPGTAAARIQGKGADSGSYFIPISGGIVKDDGLSATRALNINQEWGGSQFFIATVASLVETVRGLWYTTRVVPEFNVDMRLWDKVSTLNDATVTLPFLSHAVVGEVGGTPVVIAAENLGFLSEITSSNLLTQNGRVGFSVRVFDGYSTSTPVRLTSPTALGSLLNATGREYLNSMLFYARIATNSEGTEFREGIWAVGRRDPQRPVALSLLFDMSSLGQYNAYHNFNNHHYFAHGDDWRISRLDRFDTGTYDVPATYETLLFGGESPYIKQFEGLTIQSEELPEGATIEVQYRVNPDAEWITMGTSTSGRRHNFTNLPDDGQFTEIQFRLIATGKIVITGLTVALTEKDDLPYTV